MTAGIAYPGSKSGSGVCERLISLMPVHRVYVAGFAGHDAIFFRKRRAELSIMVDRDKTVCRWWRSYHAENLRILCADFVRILTPEAAMPDLFSPLSAMLQQNDRVDRTTLETAMRAPDTLLYVDPPYLGSTRTKQRLWRYELRDEKSHLALMRGLRSLPCMVMVSGYYSTLYERELKDWRCESYRVMTRGGPRMECVWMNYPADLPLHDCRYVGGTFRGRERLKRRCSRWVSRFRAMPPAERQMIFEALRAVHEPGAIATAGDRHVPIATAGDADRLDG